jgi:Kef-type K+ transport system membrane component KefB
MSLVAQQLGLHFIIGTFFAGLVVYRQIIGKTNFDRVYGVISAITFGFFGPIFFGLIGIGFNAQTLVNTIPFFLSLLAVAIAAKIAGGFIGARIGGFSRETSIALGSLMNGRGMVELAIASIGFALGIINEQLFSVAVGIGFVTTIIAALSSRPLLNIAKQAGSAELTPQAEFTSAAATENSQTGKSEEQ